MTKWVNISELFGPTSQYQEPDKLFIDYTPDHGEVILRGEETGLVDENGNPISQQIKTEADLGGWHPSLTKKGEIFLVSHNATKVRLAFRGKKGFDGILYLLKSIGKNCYSNATLFMKGGFLTSELFKGLSGYLQGTAKEFYWLADKKVVPCARFMEFHALIINGSGNRMDPKTLMFQNCAPYIYSCEIYDSLFGAITVTCALRPIINFHSSILVNIGDEEFNGSTPQRAMKIMREDSRKAANYLFNTMLTELEDVYSGYQAIATETISLPDEYQKIRAELMAMQDKQRALLDKFNEMLQEPISKK